MASPSPSAEVLEAPQAVGVKVLTFAAQFEDTSRKSLWTLQSTLEHGKRPYKNRYNGTTVPGTN